ncbi:acetyltransferase [Nocardioides sp. CF8]|nr:acetyltransferase [Nocardioides sp. CF8]
MRALAMLVVLVWHTLLTVAPDEPTAPWAWVITPFGGVAHAAVLTFIVLSGYLLGRHWRPGELRTESLHYLLRRGWRLLPPYWVVVTLTVVAMLVLGLRNPGGTHWDVGLPMTWGNTALNYLLLTDLAGTTPYNHPLWTVPVEFHLYFLAPLLVLVRRRAAALVVGAVLTLAVAFAAPGFVAPFFALAFAAAFWTGHHRQSLSAADTRRALRVVLPGAVVGLLVAVAVVVAGDLSQGGVRFLVLDAVATPLLIGWLLVSDLSGGAGRTHALLSSGPLRWTGARSYSTYLVHALVIEILWRFAVEPIGLAGDAAPFGVLLVLAAPLSLVAGKLLHQWVELPSARRSAAVGTRSDRLPAPSKDPA